MKNLNNRIAFLLLMVAGMFGIQNAVANTVNIPTTYGTYIDWNDAAITNASIENNGANIGSTGASTVATFTLSNETKQDYVLTFQTAANGLTGEINVTLTNSNSETIWSKVADIMNTGSWYLNETATTHQYLIESLPTGTYTLTFATKSTTGSYAGNWGKLAIYASSDYDFIPGTLALERGSYSNNNMLEGSAGNYNIGNITNGRYATYSFINNTEGIYKITMDICRYNQGGKMNIKILDETTRENEIDMTYTIKSDDPNSYTSTDILLPALLTQGGKVMKFTFSDGNSYICNYKAPTFTKVYDHMAKVNAPDITDQTVTTGENSDWYCALPVSYDANTTFSISAVYGTVEVTAVDENNESVTVTDNGDGTYSIPTPSMKATTTVTVSLTANSGSLAEKATYTFDIFRIGEISLTSVTVDGVAVDVLTDINDSKTSYSATYSGCYTTAPTVAAVQIDGADASVGAPGIEGSTYTYTIHGAIAGTDLERDYTLTLDNVHLYAATGDEESINIKANEGTIESNTWSNGVYTLATTSLDSYNQFFKMNGDSYTIRVPSDVVVKQVIMKDCSNNYAGNDARLTAVTSTGATAYVPVDNKYYHESEGAKHDIIVNLEGHTAGANIVLTQQKKGQPMAWIQLTVEKQNPGTPPVKTSQSVTVVNNHAAVSVTFDREIPNDVTATINESSVTAEGGATTLVFPVWDLSYSTNYTLTIAAGAVEDAYGNKNSSAINIAVNVPAKPAVSPAAYDYVVSDATELLVALDDIQSTNQNDKNATRKTVFLKNGDYDLGSSNETVRWVRSHNLSLIGESRDGVVIHGTSDGISNPVLNLRYWQGFYLQDLTVRNDKNYGLEDKNGVAVAIYGGDKTIMKNVRMQSNQDTQVTGDRAYFEDCKIHGTVDFICGGGDNFYYHTDLILEDRGGNVIVAPSTSTSNKWGYVFQECTIKGVDDAAAATNAGSYNLGRPWQNSPRTAFINTKMEVVPSAVGWGDMSTIPAWFVEYNSKDGNNNDVDLSSRKTHYQYTVNEQVIEGYSTYEEVVTATLTAEQAAKFTLQNVLGGTDSWLPTDYTYETAAPVVSNSGNTISWDAVDDARCYVIFKDGKYLADQIATSYDITSAGVYTVRAANEMGGLGATSNAVVSGVITPAGWSSFASSYPLDLGSIENGTAYYASAAGGETVTLTPTGDVSVPAGEGIMVKGTADDVFTIKVAANGTAIDGNLLKGQTTTGTVTASPASGAGTYHYVFGYESSSVYGFYNLAAATTVPAGKAYLETTGGNLARALRFSLGGITEVENVEAAPVATVKKNGAYLENGKIAIYKNGMKFNANGQLIK